VSPEGTVPPGARRPPRPHRLDRGGTGRRIVSARSAPSVSGLRSAAHWDAQTPRLTERKQEEGRACARYCRWPPFPAGQPPVRGRFACTPMGFGPGEGGGLRRGQATLADGLSARPCSPSPHQRGRGRPGPQEHQSRPSSRSCGGAAAPCPCPREVGVGAAAPTSGIPPRPHFGRRLLMPTEAADARRGRDHMRGDADTSESLTAKKVAKKTRSCDTRRQFSAVPCGRAGHSYGPGAVEATA
jgi:hypothetical protein